MAINPSKLLRANPIRATISASTLRGRSSFLGSGRARITAAKISAASLKSNPIVDIQNSLAEIIQILTVQNKTLKDQADKVRKSAEVKRRAGVEGSLESSVDRTVSAAEKVISPVKSLLDRIIDFILAVFIGRSIVKLIRWFSDPQNKTKVQSILRFLGDHWPKLLALYLRFGTGLGRFIGGLSSLLIRGTLRIAQAAAGLAARAGLRGAGKVAGFLGGRYGKLLSVGLEVGTTVAGTMALSKGIENFGGLDDVKMPKFAGGGLANLKKMFRFAGGSFVPGHVSGKKGVDKVPAMLTDGEFVMSRGAVQKYGVGTLEAMNAAGGGTNRPRIASGTTYAAGGGAVGEAAKLIKKEEALSSLSPGRNDYILPGGESVKSKVSWSSIKPDTTLYAYPDINGIPTIGWGATFYDKLAQGMKAVKLGDKISKLKADQILDTHLGELSSTYSRQMRHWKNMSQSQQAAILSIGYNAGPNAPLGTYPKLSAALSSGNMMAASQNVNRSGPSPERISLEQKLLLSGPRDVSKSQQTTKTPKQQPNIFQKLSNSVASIFGLNQEAKAEPRTYQSRYNGGLAPQTTSRPSRPLVISASTAKSRTSSRTSVSPPVGFMPEVVYEVVQPTTKASAPGVSGTPQVPSFSASYAGGNANKNATIYGIG